MADIWYDVDAALAEVPVNLMPLIDDTDFKSIEDNSVAYNAAGLELIWHFVTTAGAMSSTPVTPTTSGDYDWAHQDGGVYSIEIPASGGASINNDTEGFGWFTGKATGVLAWRGPVCGFRAAGINNKLVDDAYSTTRGLSGTALPDAAADAAGGLIISDAGELDADDLKADVTAILADTGTDGVIVGALNAAAVTDTEDAVWDALRSAHADAGSFGDIDTTADVADAVWDEDITTHTTADSAGEALGDAATGGDPWDTALPGSYAAGTAGKILSDILDDTGTDGVVVGADSLADMGVVASGTAQSATGTTLVLASAETFDDDELIGATLVIMGATTGKGQSRTITDYDSASDTATVDTWTTTPTGTITYAVFATPPASASALPGVNVVQISGDATAADNLELAADGTGYNLGGGSIVSASVTGAVASVGAGGIADTTFASGAIAFKKNTALAKFPFVMRDSTNHAPVTGRSVTATRSIDGAPFAAGTLSAVSEVGSGVYAVDFAAADLNGATVVLKCTATASDTTFVSIVTNP